MKKRNPIVNEATEKEYENIYSRASKLLAEFSNGVVIDLDKVYAYVS